MSAFSFAAPVTRSNASARFFEAASASAACPIYPPRIVTSPVIAKPATDAAPSSLSLLPVSCAMIPRSCIAVRASLMPTTSFPRPPSARRERPRMPVPYPSADCTLEGSWLKAFTTSVMPWTRGRSPLFASVPAPISAVSSAPPSSSRSPLRLSMRSDACSAAKPWSSTALIHSRIPASPSE